MRVLIAPESRSGKRAPTDRSVPPRLVATLGVTITLALVLLLPASVAAHARLDRSLPAVDAVVESTPIEVRIWTSQELTLSGNRIQVTDAAGTRVDNDDARVDQSDPNRKQLAVSLQPLAPGAYLVTYTLASAEDGHSATDTFTFTLADTNITNEGATVEEIVATDGWGPGDAAVLSDSNASR